MDRAKPCVGRQIDIDWHDGPIVHGGLQMLRDESGELAVSRVDMLIKYLAKARRLHEEETGGFFMP